MKLSKPQQRALNKLSRSTFKSAFDLNEAMDTLEALVKQGLAKKRSDSGYIHSPLTQIKFRKAIKRRKK